MALTHFFLIFNPITYINDINKTLHFKGIAKTDQANEIKIKQGSHLISDKRKY